MYKEEASTKPQAATVAINALLLAAVIALGLVTFFSLLEILLTISATVIFQAIDSQTRQYYAGVTVRNIWLLVGGAVWLGIVIYCLDYFFKHWRERRIQGRYLRFLAAELVIIGLQVLIAG